MRFRRPVWSITPTLKGRGFHRLKDFCEYYAGNTGGASFFVNRRTDSPAVPADFAVYLTEYLGENISSLDMDIPVWKKAKENASSTLHRITDLNLTADNDVSAWDLSLSPEAAGIHLEMSQKLLSSNTDIDRILRTYDEVLTGND